MTRPQNSAVGRTAEKSGTQTAETCVVCGRFLIPRGPNGECLRCLGSFAFELESETSMKTPTRFAHFEVEVGEDGDPVELGAGAMGVTYRARDTILECTVALKIIDTQRAGDPAARTRFLREARAAARLHHPNVAQVTYYGEQDGDCFYVMEFVEGETLEERVRREGPLAPPLALEIGVQAARALAAAESCGVIHRDLKPSNLMIASRQGESETGDSLLVKIIDFGIAKIMGSKIDQTQADFIGTPAYASPEQFGGSGETQVDTRSDIYSLGITLWYLISGRTPFVGRTLEEIQKKQSDELPLEQLRMANVPDKMTALLKSMLAVDPGDRPQSARELLDAIQRCRKEEDDEPAMIEAALRREEGFWTAVLPFRFSGDPEIAGFAEGLTEEIVTGMARFPYLRVVARNLTARYLSESIVVRRVGNELGARYLLEGSLRQAGNKLRIAVQLVDTDSGEHLWAETFDRVWQAEEIFDLQDEITDCIIGSVADVYGVLARAIATSTANKPPENLTPYEAVWRFYLAEQRGSAEDHLLARIALEKAVELQPGYAEAWAALAVLLVDEYRYLFNPRPNSLERAMVAAQRALDADSVSQMANYAFAVAQYFRGDLGAFRAAAERALALNPRCSYTMAWVGRLFCYSGDWERGIELSRRAIQLSPHHPGWYHFSFFHNEYRQRHYAEALAVLQTINMPGYWVTHLITAMTQAQLGNQSAAQTEVERTLQLCPKFEQFFGRTHLQKWIPNQPDLVKHMLEGVKLAGFRILEEESRAATPATARPGTLSPVALQPELTGPRPDLSASPPISPVKRHSVGRQKELAELGRAFESAAAGQGLFLCVTGEPGIGKTTLVEDFLGELAATGRPCALARGRCSERLAGAEAYLPFLEALESLLHGDGGEAAARVMKASPRPGTPRSRRRPPRTPPWPACSPEAKAASQERLKRELGAFLQEVSRLRPLLLFLDDLHWADASTVDLLAYLGGKCAGLRALLVLTYRPTDLLLGKHPFGPVKLDLQARGVCREVALEFLTRPDIERYLALEFPEHRFPEEFAALVHARTEGSPLFMVDLLRYLRDRQVLTQEQGRWTLGQSVPDLQRELPESVRSMIQRKIDQLGEDDRRLLVAASVQGYEFDSAVVARVLERDAAEVEERLDELDRVHAFVRLVREHEFPDRTLTLRYRFVHVLYQNALYASLRPTRRASLERGGGAGAAGLLRGEERGRGRRAGVALGGGAGFRAGRGLFPGWRPRTPPASSPIRRPWCSRAGGWSCSRRCRTRPSAPARNSPCKSPWATPLIATKGWTAPEVERAYTRAHELCRQLGETPDLFPALWGLWLFHIARGEIQTARNLGEQLLGLAQRARGPGCSFCRLITRWDRPIRSSEIGRPPGHTWSEAIALYDPRAAPRACLSLRRP